MKLPRFTLRELFLLIVIAAMGCGWWVEHRKMKQLEDHCRKQIMELAVEMAAMSAELGALGRVKPLSP